MRKLIEVKNATDDRVCDLVREDDNSLCYHMKYRDKSGHARDVVIAVSDMIYPAWEHMTEGERRHILNALVAYRI